MTYAITYDVPARAGGYTTVVTNSRSEKVTRLELVRLNNTPAFTNVKPLTGKAAKSALAEFQNINGF